MFVGAAAWIALALVVAGLAIAYLFARAIEQRVRDDLEATLTRLVAVTEPARFSQSLASPLADARYATPFGGRYFEVTRLDTGEVAASRSLWDFDIVLPPAAVSTESQYAVIRGPLDQSLSTVARLVTIRTTEGDVPFFYIVAEDRAGLMRAIADFRSNLVIALAILGAALLGAALLQVHLGLRPLAALRDGIERVRGGHDRRLADTAVPSEVRAVVTEVNDLLTLQETSIAFARARAEDLAHGLKTPLSVLATTAEDLRVRSDATTADLVAGLTEEMADRIEYQLRLSRLRVRTAAQAYSASVKDTIDRTVAVLRRTRSGEQLDWELDVDPNLLVDLDRHDLVELLGVVLENAAEWGREKVKVAAAGVDGHAVITIEDDGPGVSEDRRSMLGQRGHKAEDGDQGHGLGLSIAAEIVRLNNGTIDFRKGGSGGLRVSMALPLAAWDGASGKPRTAPSA